MKNWSAQLDDVTKQVFESFGSLTIEQLNWKPNAHTWSIAQNIQHLIVVNESYYPILNALRSGSYKPPFLSKIGFVVSLLGKTILKAVKPDRKDKMKTFPIWEPTSGNLNGNVLTQFQQHQAKLETEIDSAKKFIEEGVVIASPANKNIVYKLETAFDIIVSHEQRHFEQAKEVLQLLKSNT